ncbi:hypothetical protein EK21DRAFT_71723 [Setomelanomma holmii]|uniref:Uncharacterized protein n=1 Tax=Setomelanomma holmii TaxID=210430 RepID=A0A9P4LJD8_9PLEO|nr:hypothetical protein EK21DRAFT_71723 [Setomelanomma holmii]
MLRRLHKHVVEVNEEGKLERKKSKRQRIVQFFQRSRKQTPQNHDQATKPHLVDRETGPPAKHADEAPLAAAAEPSISPAVPEATEGSESKETDKTEALSKEHLRTLFSGAPHFGIQEEHGRLSPAVSYPWNNEGSTKGLVDSIGTQQPAFAAVSLRDRIFKTKQASPSEHKQYQGYEGNTVELPDMRSAQGSEPGSIGFRHFLELSISDSLLTDVESSQSSKDFLQGSKSQELLQSTPERIGIRAVDMSLVYDRLIEFQDLYEVLSDSPRAMTILNNQSAGDLYANLFSKFLTPPGYDGTDDPTGLRIQIVTLMRILKLKGIWYDFSLVEWRIRLGQILWSDPEPVPEHESQPLWTEREVLLLQITLACELLLRLDAVAIAETDPSPSQSQFSVQEIRSFFGKKTRKLDWDLVLARRWLENILVVKPGEPEVLTKSKRFLSMLNGNEEQKPSSPDIVLLPQHQARQLAGLLHFAETLQWPNIQIFMQELTQKLGLRGANTHTEQLPSPDPMLLDPVTPASISVYGTPLQTPRSASHVLDGYFGHVGKPALSRDHSQSLRIPLSPTLSPVSDRPGTLSSVGGWLSRSYLTGLTLPGEPLSHFLVSTLLENDREAINSLGDSANLYGGFSYAGRTWWSKNSIVGRVLACVTGAAECMGWISVPKLPEGHGDGWHSIHSEQIPFDGRLVDPHRSAAVALDSAILAGDNVETATTKDLTLPRDIDTRPTSTTIFVHWELTALNPDLMDSEVVSGPPTESDIYTASLVFATKDQGRTYTLNLLYDVHFISSWPCKPPAASTPTPSMPQILKRSLTGTTSHSSSKRSDSTRLSRRNSHGFEPLLSHPPDSTNIAPTPTYTSDVDDELHATKARQYPMDVHPLHKTYRYEVAALDDVLDPDYIVPFDIHAHTPRALSPTSSGIDMRQDQKSSDDKKLILVLDARGSNDLQLLARAWCAEKGYHAIIGRIGRTCLACCIREARSLGVNVVIRV